MTERTVSGRIERSPAEYRLWVNEERTVLVRWWRDSDLVEVATRETSSGIWGPPVYLTEETHG